MTAVPRAGAVGGSTATTLGDVVRSGRRRLLVGRDGDVESFRATLDSDDPSIWFVHGPGGVGKSSLLDLLTEAAHECGVPVIRVDARTLQRTRRALQQAVEPPPTAARHVVMIDAYEQLRELESWFRSAVVPRLPATTVLVLAGRDKPDPEWRTDPAWRQVLRAVRLGNLERKACEEYLQLTAADPRTHERIIELTHGHPLGLSLLTDVTVRGGVLDTPLGPDLVAILLGRFLDVVPDGAQRHALGVLALARVTTEPLLRAALNLDDAHDLFTWLQELSFVESTPHGLQPHDLARDALDADLRWRDLLGYTDAFRKVADHLVATLKTSHGETQLRALMDAKFMHRHQPIARVWADWDTFGRSRPEPATADDHDAVLDMIERWEGPESASIAARWLTRQPHGFAVVRQADGQVRGALGLIDLTAASAQDIDADPGARAAWAHAQRDRPRRAGDVITMSRFTIDREAYQQPSPTMNLAPVLSIRHYLRTPGLRASFIVMDDPRRWQDYFGFYEIRRVSDGDFYVGGRRFGLFVRDFRHLSLDPWLRLMFERDLVGETAAGPPHAPEAALTREDFHTSVRQALRDLRRPDRLSANALARSRQVLTAAGESTRTDILRDLVLAAVRRLGDDPRDEKLFRALDRTFLRPAASQERAAEVLDLPMSTYKRHLKAGLDRVVDDLWARELDLE